jgi:N-carbamoylputrescine amidase
MNKVKVGIAQMSCVEDKQQNIERYTEKVRELAAGGAQIICLQELFASLYFCDEERYENFKLAEAIPEGPTTQHFMALAKELGVVLVC